MKKTIIELSEADEQDIDNGLRKGFDNCEFFEAPIYIKIAFILERYELAKEMQEDLEFEKKNKIRLNLIGELLLKKIR